MQHGHHHMLVARHAPVALLLLLAALLACCGARPAAAGRGHKAGKAPLPASPAVSAAGTAGLASPQLMSGAAAVASLGSDVNAVADYYDMSVSELEALLLRDKGLHMDAATRELLYTCNFSHASSSPGSGGSASAAGAPNTSKSIGLMPGDPFPLLSQWNMLHSRPGASKTIFLDFRGCNVPGPTPWRTSGQPISTGPYDLYNDGMFTDDDKEQIIHAWLYVAFDFIDLDVDVTTEDPGLDALLRTSEDDTRYGFRVCIGDTFDEPTSIGLAFFDSFSTWDPSYGPTNWGYQPAWVFANGLPGGRELSFAISHVIGHVLGLQHDGCTTDNTDYYDGMGEWAPIMGARHHNGPFVTFDRGEYPCANNQQQDYDVMTRPGYLAYTPDDGVGDRPETALQLCGSNASVCTPLPSDPSVTVTTVTVMFSTGRHNGTDRKVFKLEVEPYSPIQMPNMALSLYGNVLAWTSTVLDAKSTVVRDTSWHYVTYQPHSGGTYYIVIDPVTLPGQPSIYGVAGPLSLTFTFTPPCPSVGLPKCVDEASGTSIANCTTTTMHFCQPNPISGVLCRYTYKDDMTVCRAAAGPCDAVEVCDGRSAACPADLVKPNCSPTCPTNGLPACVSEATGTWVEPPEVCTSDADGFCQPVSGSDFVCRYAYKASTELCRDASNDCELPAFCSGSDSVCPPNKENPDCAVACETSGLPDCVDAESGVLLPRNMACVTNTSHWCARVPDAIVESTCAYAYKKSGTACRAARGPCDTAATCSGKSASCQANKLRAKGYICRQATGGSCDVAERCTGSSTACPTDAVAPSTLACRAAADPCAASYCNGKAKTCPSSVRVKDNTGCSANPKGIFRNSAALSAATPAQAKAKGWVKCGKCIRGVCNVVSTLRWCWN